MSLCTHLDDATASIIQLGALRSPELQQSSHSLRFMLGRVKGLSSTHHITKNTKNTKKYKKKISILISLSSNGGDHPRKVSIEDKVFTLL